MGIRLGLDVQPGRSRSNVLVLHDIVNEFTPGPDRVWQMVKATCRDEFDFFEHTDQYPEIRVSLGKSVLGLGLAVRKNWVSASHP